MKITRRRALEEAMEIFEARKRCFSAGMRSQIPAEGYEKAYEAEEQKAEIIRQIMREENREPLPPMRNQIQEPICGECGMNLGMIEKVKGAKYCCRCGREIKWQN